MSVICATSISLFLLGGVLPRPSVAAAIVGGAAGCGQAGHPRRFVVEVIVVAHRALRFDRLLDRRRGQLGPGSADVAVAAAALAVEPRDEQVGGVVALV